MRILFIVRGLQKGGAERLVLDISNEIIKQGKHEVKIAGTINENEYPELSERVDFIHLKDSVRLSLLKKNIYHVEDLEKLISEFKPDIIHSHLFESEILARIVIHKDVRYFSHFHDNMVQLSNLKFPFRKNDITNLYEKYFLMWKYFKTRNQFICISNSTFRYAKSVIPNYLNKKIILLPNAINYSKFSKYQKFDKQNIKLRLINVGRFYSIKNQKLCIEILKKLIENNIDTELTLIGDGPDIENVKNLVQKYGLDKNVYFKEKLQNIEKEYYLNDIYLHTATYEPFGLVLLEAMASGLPVVALNGGGNADIIENGRNGYIIDDQKAQIFADKILIIWRNKDLYRQMSEYARDYAKSYDIKEYVDKLLKIYSL